MGAWQGLGSYLALLLLTLFLARHALLLCGVWLLVTWIHGAYQYRFAFAPDRPFLYAQTVEVLLLLDVACMVALAPFTVIGWWTLAPLALTWFGFGRLVGALAAAKQLRRIAAQVRRDYGRDPEPEQASRIRRILADRVETLAPGGWPAVGMNIYSA